MKYMVAGGVGGACCFLILRFVAEPWNLFWAAIFSAVYGLVGSRAVAAYNQWCVKRDDESTS